jgi:hypothetical protein
MIVRIVHKTMALATEGAEFRLGGWSAGLQPVFAGVIELFPGENQGGRKHQNKLQLRPQ